MALGDARSEIERRESGRGQASGQTMTSKSRTVSIETFGEAWVVKPTGEGRWVEWQGDAAGGSPASTTDSRRRCQPWWHTVCRRVYEVDEHEAVIQQENPAFGVWPNKRYYWPLAESVPAGLP